MNALRNFFARALFWTYSRGSWQWDLCCLFIICIIFSTPKDFLLSHTHRSLTPDQIETIVRSFFSSLF